MLGWGLFLVSVAVGLTFMADARAYRLGLAVVVAMHLFDRFLTPGRTIFRVPLSCSWAAWAWSLPRGWLAPSSRRSPDPESDALRLELISEGFSSALLSGGFGRGLGTEKR